MTILIGSQAAVIDIACVASMNTRSSPTVGRSATLTDQQPAEQELGALFLLPLPTTVLFQALCHRLKQFLADQGRHRNGLLLLRRGGSRHHLLARGGRIAPFGT